MGFFKKVFKPVRKIAKKIIPKEIRPFLPYIAAAFGPAGLAGTKFAAMNPAFQKALIAGVTSAATDEQGDPLRAALLAGAPDALQQGLGKFANVYGAPGVDSMESLSFMEKLGEGARALSGPESKLGALVNPSGFKEAATLIGGQTAIDQSAKFAEIRQDEIDAYNKSLQEQGVLDKTKRRASIYNIYINAGYEPDYVNSMLDRYGYESGGRIGFAKGGYRGKAEEAMGLMTMDDLLKRTPVVKEEEEEEKITVKRGEKGKVKPKASDVNITFESEETEPNYAEAMSRAMSGVEAAFGIPFGGVKPAEFKRFARGGEVEIEEETDDLGIMDFMRDQGIEYGEQASNMQNDEILQNLYEEFLDLGFSPEDAAKKARQAFDEMSQKPNEGIMQMASGYKTDIEEMYEQYVFEMEEMGLQPMSFSQFEARERAGMADGGKAKRRKKGQEDDSDGKKPGPRSFPEFDKDKLFEEKMPQVLPNKPDMMEAAMGGIASMADGGIMEKDMRGGGFIPEGTKERADDVPARLSKNEFVMTADAVRAAGGGSVNQGAKKMYDMMYQLEGKV